MRKSLTLLFISLFACLYGAGQNTPNRDEIKLQSDFKDIGQTTWRLWGNVMITFEDYQIYAQYLQYNTETHEIYADGQVIIVNKGNIIRGEQLLLNTKTKNGDLYQVMGFISPYLEYETDHLHQVDDETYTFSTLRLSSCSQRVPRWQLSGGSGQIKKGKYVVLNNIVMRIKSIPIFYFPFLYYPISESQRTTGFQMPKFGYSAVQGFFVHNSFYLNIAPNLDATFYGDYFANMGTGTGSEFRYLFDGGKGNLTGYMFFYSATNTLNEKKASDYSLVGQHMQTFASLNSNLTISLNYASNSSIQRVLNNQFDRSLTATYVASLYWTTSFFKLFNLSINVARNEIYFVPTNTSLIMLSLPSVALTMPARKLFGLPGRFSLRTDFKYGLRQGISYLNEPVYGDDLKSLRFSLIPEYSLKTNVWPWLGGGVTLTSYTNIYLKSLSPIDFKTPIADTLVTNFQKIVCNLWGPMFTRVFDSDFSKFKHTFYPEINFQYSTKIPDELKNRVIRIDPGDFPGFSSISADLITTLDYKSKDTLNATAENIVAFKLAQTYYFDPAEANMFRKIGDVYPQFSELSATFSIAPPGRPFYLYAGGAYNYYIKGFSSLNLQAGIGDIKSIFLAKIGYLIDNNPFQNNFLNRSYATGQVALNFPDFPLIFSGDAFYDLTEGDFRYMKMAVKLDYQCLTFHGEFSLNKFGTTIYPQYTFGFTFGNYTGTSPALAK